MRPSVSVVVVNRGREWSLSLTLQALKRQRGITAEIIVVSDAPAPRDLSVTWLRHADANISSARNAGLVASKGEIIAFCDDDAIPEPDWLLQLSAAFDAPVIGAVGGPVLGGNGVRVQWGETRFDRAGRDSPDGPYVKLHGTNMALRRTAIAAIGGFDTRFAYYLDETDMLLRLVQAGWRNKWTVGALVHHAAHSNAVRGAGSTIDGFRQLGRSVAAFTLSHADEGEAALAAQHLQQVQWHRLRKMHDIGFLSGTGFARRLEAVEHGLQTPAPRATQVSIPTAHATPPSPPADRPRIALAPRMIDRRTAKSVARDLNQKGFDVTLITQTWLNRPMRVRWCHDGYFHHRGGLFRDGNHVPKWNRAVMWELIRTDAHRRYTHLILGKRRGGGEIFDLGQKPIDQSSINRNNKLETVARFDANLIFDALQHQVARC
ncbi:Glycosyltransferase, GT2 family [Monaibacterium marinum]|uniref:Glycosyltransferase, GT2 family n=1 Tax=Pontivivens marinum TaxID=1690039 RepID=A0A2C9CPC2_9RHOB|nr:glycosyltransferase [Monaibacterium marinum]SOH93077.1 Glycosyltransferase, GT2 family [Monaibacterium marinum]